MDAGRATLADLQGRLPDLLIRDARRLRRRLDGVRRMGDSEQFTFPGVAMCVSVSAMKPYLNGFTPSFCSSSKPTPSA